MVKRILEQESAVRAVLSADRKVSHLVPSWQDMEVLQSINSALSPLSSLTDILSGETYVTVSAVLPMLQLIESSILKEKDDDTQLTKDLKIRVITDLRNRYPASNEIHKILQLATFFDPRFKSKSFSESDLEDMKERIVLEIIAVPPATAQPSEPSCSSTEPPPAKRKKSLGSFFLKHENQPVPSSTAALSAGDQCRKEIEDYLQAPKLDFEEDPLLWWKGASLKLPILSGRAKKYLCVCATSSPSERVFSCSGNIVTPLRASMNPFKVDMLTFLNKNLK